MNACDEKLKSCIIEISDREMEALEKEMQDFESHVFSDRFKKKMEDMMQVEEPQTADEKLRDCILRVMEQEMAEEEAEMQELEPHVFSEEFERKMEEIMRVTGPQNPRDKLKSCITEVMDDLDDELEEEMENLEPHVFSEEFEKKMEDLIQTQNRKARRYDAVRYIAAVVVTVLLVGGVLFVGNEEVRASKIGVDILEWMEGFFVVEEKSQEDDGVLFEESQIGYLPEGFEKVEESVRFSKVCYRYQNEFGDYIVLEVRRNKIESMVDNEEIGQDVSLNVAGLEYRYIYKEDSKENIVVWKDTNEIYYQLQGTYDKEEIIKMMNGISY